MSLPATDSFARDTIGSNWTTIPTKNALLCRSDMGVVYGTGAGGSWNADSFASDHYSEVDVRITYGASDICGPAIRIQTGAAAKFYLGVIRDAARLRLYRCDSGSWSSIASEVAVTIVDGDLIRTRGSGSSIVVSQNGTDKITTTDSTYTDGSAGIYIDSNEAYNAWEGGNLAASSTTYLQGIMQHHFIPSFLGGS